MGRSRRNRLFFFGNLERLELRSETSVSRNVPSICSARWSADVSVCACTGSALEGPAVQPHGSVPVGWYGMTPAEIAGIDVLGIGPSRAASQGLQPVLLTGLAGNSANNIDSFRFAAPIENLFWTFIGRVDYNLSDQATTSCLGVLVNRTTRSTIHHPFRGSPRSASDSSTTTGWRSATMRCSVRA